MTINSVAIDEFRSGLRGDDEHPQGTVSGPVQPRRVHQPPVGESG
jgi:hypothetical protein